MEAKEKEVKKNRIEELLAKAKTVDNAALKSALEKHAEEEMLREETRIMRDYSGLTTCLRAYLDELSNVRKQEKLAKNRVSTIDAVIKKFETDGDTDKAFHELRCKGIYVH